MFAPDTRFLVVDDYSSIRRVLRKILSELGFQFVDEADDGDVALLLLKQAHEEGKPFGVIIADWNMPKLSGLDLLRTCKGNPLFRNIPYIMATAESEQAQIILAVKAGVSEYVVKPFNAAIIKEKLIRAHSKVAPPKAGPVKKGS